VSRWRESQLTDVTAKLIIYQALIESEIDLPKHLAVPMHQLYFNPEHEEFVPRTMWSLSNAFTSALKRLDPVPQYRAGRRARFFPRNPSVGLMRGSTWCVLDWAEQLPRRGALEVFERTGAIPRSSLARPAAGNWGDFDAAGRNENNLVIENGFRILSVYQLADGTQIRIITEADRSVTTILLPEEY